MSRWQRDIQPPSQAPPLAAGGLPVRKLGLQPRDLGVHVIKLGLRDTTPTLTVAAAAYRSWSHAPTASRAAGELPGNEPLRELARDGLHDRAEQVGLVAEMVMQHAAGDAGAGHDLLGRRTRVLPRWLAWLGLVEVAVNVAELAG
jgi:hypothetical protein